MRRLLAVLVLVSAWTGIAWAKPPPLAITNVTVVDVRGGPSRPGMTVLVRDGRIASVASKGAVPRGARVLDGRGKHLIPGLWDMHVHLSYQGPSALPLFLAHGVTGVRDLGSLLNEIDPWRDQIDAGVRDGPRIVRAGPMINGRSSNPYQMAVTTAEEARGAVRALKYAGVDLIKTHRRTERPAYFAAVAEAKAQGLPFVGHIPMTVTPEEAADAGQGIEHAETLFEGTFATSPPPGGLGEWLKGEASASLFRRFAANGNFFTPMTVPWASDARSLGPDATDERLRLVAASRRKAMAEQKVTPAEVAAMKRNVETFHLIVRRAHEFGVKMLAGSDGGPTRPPGVLLAEELGYLVASGLSPLEALQAATLNPAEAMRRAADFGAVEPGKLADLVLLDADPLADIGNVARVSAVVAQGRLYRRADLDRLIRDGVALAAAN
jgi:imidazolonepropionase-like amidohydrolase